MEKYGILHLYECECGFSIVKRADGSIVPELSKMDKISTLVAQSPDHIHTLILTGESDEHTRRWNSKSSGV